ncbi:hypothetical protein [Nodularia spumigena]|uniref:hypothetical protein n=1 Tax=Nodularia spumigena TaxID=70799 RepID=UPI002B2193BE|nr:hypothetical protein [Nodularia spumigena]MEA5559508.1 hypothetical protein [Nodularia spumigena CH309]
MSYYVLRYFFDAGSGICLWAGNEEAEEKFGYPVELHEIDLSDNVQRTGQRLVAWFDTSIDWNDPAGPSPWSEQERGRFQEESRSFLSMLRQCLGPDFEVRDESLLGTAGRSA